jgi:putative tRNA adenosine deaminase-associated protein
MGTQVVNAEDVESFRVFWREEGTWQVSTIPARSAISMEALIGALSRFPGEGGVFGAVAVNDEFFVLVRESGQGRQIVVSDGAAAWDWSLAEEAIDMLGLSEDDVEEFEPAGDVRLLEDFGVNGEDIELLCGNEDLYPDEQLAAIADRLGIAALWARASA